MSLGLAGPPWPSARGCCEAGASRMDGLQAGPLQGRAASGERAATPRSWELWVRTGGPVGASAGPCQAPAQPLQPRRLLKVPTRRADVGLGGVRGHLHRDFVLTSPQGTGSSRMNHTYLYINTCLF